MKLIALALVGVTSGVLWAQHHMSEHPVMIYKVVEAKCHKPWLSPADERAVCAIERAQLMYVKAHPRRDR